MSEALTPEERGLLQRLVAKLTGRLPHHGRVLLTVYRGQVQEKAEVLEKVISEVARHDDA